MIKSCLLLPVLLESDEMGVPIWAYAENDARMTTMVMSTIVEFKLLSKKV